MAQWRKSTELQNVWEVVDGFEILKNGSKKAIKISIQEIPNEETRRNEVIDHLTKYFLNDEPMCKSLKLKQNPDAVSDFKIFWNYGLDQEISTGAYKMNSKGEIGELVGVNLLFVMTEQTFKDFEEIGRNNLKSKEFKKVWQVCGDLSKLADVRKIYNIQDYLSSISLSVDPDYRGQKLGWYMLKARDKLGLKYGLLATSTVFTAKASQLQAKRAGFEEAFSRDFNEILDNETGETMFPGIESKCVKVMMKRF